VNSGIIQSLSEFLQILKNESELLQIDAQVDPYLEIAEIHRRVIARGGPALLFTNVLNSTFPVVTNLFGTKRRMELAFGQRPQQFVKDLVRAAETIMPPSLDKLWSMRSLIFQGMKVGTKTIQSGPVLEVHKNPPQLRELPLLTSWHSDGGPFVTLPLVYTEHPDGRGHNLGMYRIQRYDDTTTGIHWQIHKGGGYHYHAAEQNNQNLPLTLYIGTRSGFASAWEQAGNGQESAWRPSPGGPGRICAYRYCSTACQTAGRAIWRPLWLQFAAA
jgi:UbiD family decarboxylase